MKIPHALGRAWLRLLRWMDRRWVVSGMLLIAFFAGVFFGVGPERFSRATVEAWIPLAFAALALVAAVIGGYADRGERAADVRYEAFQRALAERERRDAGGAGRSGRPE